MEKMTLEQFGDVIKKKYPEYANRDTAELAEAYLKKNPVYKSKVAQPEIQLAPRTDMDKGFVERVGDRFNERKGQMEGIIDTALHPSKTDTRSDLKASVDAVAGSTGRAASFISDVAGEALKSGFRALPGNQTSGVEGALRSGGRKVMESTPGQAAGGLLSQGVKKAEEFEQKHPVLGAGGRIGLAALDLYGAGKLAQGGMNLARRGASQADDLARSAGSKIASTADDVYTKVANKADDLKVAEKVLGKPKTPSELVGSIVQGQTDDIPRATRALQDPKIDLTNVKTYKDLSTKLDDQIRTYVKEVDDVFDANPRLLTSDDLTRAVKVGEKTVKTNYVQKALDNLEELYLKTEAADDVERIVQLREKIKVAGITPKEVNDLAREYGRVQSGFNFSGTPSTSVTKQGYENIRTGIKQTARSFMPDEATKALDGKITDLIKTRELADDMVEKVNALSQRVANTTVVEKLTKKAMDAFNVITMGGPRQMLFSLMGLRNQGFKMLNALDLEKQLPKILKKLDELIATSSDDVLARGLEKLLAPTSAKAAFTAKTPPLLTPVANKKAIIPLLRPRGNQD